MKSGRIANDLLSFLKMLPAFLAMLLVVGLAYVAWFGAEIPMEHSNHGYLKAECVRRGYGFFNKDGFFELYPFGGEHGKAERREAEVPTEAVQ